MSKRVFELARELNTTSKRLIEKLEEINIKVKSHMSLLDDDELDRLYDHIGVVNRDRISGSDDDGSSTEQSKQTEIPVRKTIPRIIRKTEIIIHDDDYENVNREKKKNRRGIVRPSSSTDGLMAGLQRGGDIRYPSIRKHTPESHSKESEITKKEEPKADNIKDAIEDDIISVTPRERKRRPVDHIISIKKVASRDELEKTGSDEAKKEGVQAARPKKEPIKSKETESDTKKAADIQKDTVSADAEKINENMVIDTQIITQQHEEKAAEQVTVAPETKATVGKEQQVTGDKEKSAEKKEPTIEKQDITVDKVKTPMKTTAEEFTTELREHIDERKKAETPHVGKGHIKSDVPEQRHAKARDGRGQTRDKHGKPAPLIEEQQSISAKGSEEQSGSSVVPDELKIDPKARDTAKETLQRRGTEKDDTGRRQSRVDNESKDYIRDTGDLKADARRDRDIKRDKSSGRKDEYDRGKDKGMRSRDSGWIRGTNKQLIIPKANIIPGQIEEKSNIRGERRSSILKDQEKGFKREIKRDIIKPAAVQSSGKGRDKYRKNYVIGHTANVSDMYSDDYVLNEFYEEKERLKKEKNKRKEEKHIPPKAVLHEITIPETISVKSLAEALKKTAAEVIKKLMSLGVMATLNQELDFDTAAIIGEEFGVKVKQEVVITDEEILFDDEEDKEEDLMERAPVVVVMGHVDHGKTSLLDAIRKTNVADKEAGGITQHIGAYQVKVNDRLITFLDTPGHEAFTAMRARGAQATDIAILVVAADDGVMPQTVEAINHAKAANVNIIVAINKIDKPGANPERVKQELAERGVLIEEWGGDVVAVPVSAKLGTNIDQLLEMVLLTADIMELKANPNRQAKGIIIEAKLDKGRGPVATALVQRGTLRSGDSVISGTAFGRIRAMTDDNGRRIEAAGPSTPVEVIGLNEVPEAGEVFYVVSDEKVAKHLVEKRKEQLREQAIGSTPRVTLDDLFSQIQKGDVKELNIIVKADVQGSVEAVTQSVEKLSNEEVKVQVIHGGVGSINEADVTLASVSNAIIIGFNVRPPANVIESAREEGVDIRLYRVIYNAIEDIEKAMKGLLAPTFKEVIDGHAEIRQIFKASSIGTIGGSYVTDGKIMRNSEVRVIRDGIVVYEGKLASLKRFKDDVREVSQGYECGILIDRFNDIKEGDVIEAFRMEEVER